MVTLTLKGPFRKHTDSRIVCVPQKTTVQLNTLSFSKLSPPDLELSFYFVVLFPYKNIIKNSVIPGSRQAHRGHSVSR